VGVAFALKNGRASADVTTPRTPYPSTFTARSTSSRRRSSSARRSGAVNRTSPPRTNQPQAGKTEKPGVTELEAAAGYNGISV